MKYGRALCVAMLLGIVVSGCSKEDPKAFSKVDYNKDGKIIFEELVVAYPDMTVEEFLAADADHNGVLDQREYEVLRAARAAGKKLGTDTAAASAPAANKPAEPAKPAAPAVAPEPAKTAAEPAKPVAPPAVPAPATSAPANTPEPAKAPEPAKPAAPEPETVETVEVGGTDTAATPAGQTYTVERGDNLSRIARKFKVTPKAIMEANNLKSADHLEAGSTITIPAATTGAPASAEIPPAVADFVTGYFSKIAAGDINGLLDYYGERVNYYKKGKTGKDIVRQDKASVVDHWPTRSYTPGKPAVEKLARGDLRVVVPVSFSFKNGGKSLEGQAKYTFLLHPAGTAFRIVGEQSLVTEKKK